MRQRVYMSNGNKGKGLRPVPRLLLSGLLALPLAGCDTEEILTVNDPEFPTEVGLEDERFTPAVIAGAIADFQIAYGGPIGGNVDAFVSIVGAFTDELYSAGSFPTRTVLDRRDLFSTQQGNATDNAYVELHQARRALRVAALRAQTSQAPAATVANLKALEGYTYVALGEGWCSGIPFSEVVGGEFTPGAPLSSAEVYRAAVAKFDSALAITPSLGLARVGKGRALLNLGLFQEAADAVAPVERSYVFHLERSSNTTSQNNSLFSLADVGRYSVSNDEGGEGPPFGPAGPGFPGGSGFDENLLDDTGNGLSFLLERDPRVPWAGPFVGFSPGIPKYFPLRYPSLDADIPLASGVEARLVQAEAALRAGNIDLWLSTLNDLRANADVLMAILFPEAPNDVFATQLQPLQDPGAAQRLALQYKERAFWLYLTGTRLGDYRRLVRIYDMPADQVYPMGPYFKGGFYGDDKSFPIPFTESNNPLFDINSCNTEQA